MDETVFANVEQSATMRHALLDVRAAGYTPSVASSWEDNEQVWAFSVESDPSCLGHPLFEVHYWK